MINNPQNLIDPSGYSWFSKLFKSIGKFFKNLSGKGVTVSLDDFGSGYSSLNYLKALPVNTVKIDRTFVKNLPTSADDLVIAKAIIVMAHNLKLRVVAEGVETKSQLELLRKLKCDYMQGVLYSRPLPPQKAIKLLTPRRSLAARRRGWAGRGGGDGDAVRGR